jgi:hypothetical protein
MSLQGGISGTGEREITASNEPERVPWMEGTGGYEIQSHFLGKTVTEADLKFQVEFWIHAGYDYVLLTVGMMTPGEITRKSSIVGVVQKAMRGTVLSMTTFIGTRHVIPGLTRNDKQQKIYGVVYNLGDLSD